MVPIESQIATVPVPTSVFDIRDDSVVKEMEVSSDKVINPAVTKSAPYHTKENQRITKDTLMDPSGRFPPLTSSTVESSGLFTPRTQALISRAQSFVTAREDSLPLPVPLFESRPLDSWKTNVAPPKEGSVQKKEANVPSYTASLWSPSQSSPSPQAHLRPAESIIGTTQAYSQATVQAKNMKSAVGFLSAMSDVNQFNGVNQDFNQNSTYVVCDSDSDGEDQLSSLYYR